MGRRRLPTGGFMGWMTDPATGGLHGHAAGTTGPVPTMPGMASSSELAALRAASGPQLDVMFLQLMLRHHEGGAEMLRYGAEYAAVPQVRNLATQMLRSQTAENDYMRQLLAQRGAQPLPG
ncbi:hypothetical protein BJF78_12305 [Pseudonocardia sp. CNS-139]|nr:hypothetical protein BJF78_12305 [Pseudonocardia sp. CNS-139]